MEIKNLKLKIWTITLLTLILSLPKGTQAQSLDLSVSPPIFQVELTPPANAKAEQELTVENTGDEPLVLDLVFRAFEPTNAENGTLTLIPQNRPIPGANPHILDRIEVLEDGEPIDRLRLGPGQTKKLDLTIAIPKDEPPSDYYLTLIFLSQLSAATDNTTSNTLTTGGVGVNLLLSVGPQSETTGNLKEFSTPFFKEHGPVPFTVRLENTSKHFIYPKGIITIKNMFGQTIGQVELLPVNILSNSTRALPSSEQFSFLAEREEAQKNPLKKKGQDTELLYKDLDLKTPTAFWKEVFLLGPYTATLEIALSDQGPVIVRTIHFIGFPLYILIGVAVVAILLIFIRSRLKKRENRMMS